MTGQLKALTKENFRSCFRKRRDTAGTSVPKKTKRILKANLQGKQTLISAFRADQSRLLTPHPENTLPGPDAAISKNTTKRKTKIAASCKPATPRICHVEKPQAEGCLSQVWAEYTIAPAGVNVKQSEDQMSPVTSPHQKYMQIFESLRGYSSEGEAVLLAKLEHTTPAGLLLPHSPFHAVPSRPAHPSLHRNTKAY
ncbi:hypothetical protein H920_13487 [Fukomys damarensis]|uniref:Uncharacterized protein n=1 Tax=Fukomys damarensis TaxID=885580 RepID=A0A091CZ63_FUKDA|nr:hypothetical protein H920_13487 [Fukomys damarensis]